VRVQLRRDLSGAVRGTLLTWTLALVLTALYGSASVWATGDWSVPLLVAGVVTVAAGACLLVAALALTGLALSLNWPRDTETEETQSDEE
jgi:hypothetical protein